MQNAYTFAENAHRGQVRSYTGEPYITHCLEVAGLVALAGFEQFVVQAALLHDTIEDTDTDYCQIAKVFGYQVADIVYFLTEPTKIEGVTRAKRLKIYNEKLMQGCFETRSIKCADIISNCRNIVKLDRKFAKTYLKEKRATLDLFAHSDCHLGLREEANRIVDNGIMELKND